MPLFVAEPYIPAAAVPYCRALWNEGAFALRIARSRRSKLGDYRYDPAKNQHFISVNGNLNPYQFLITYIHEIAHFHVQNRHTHRPVAPHGREWQHCFAQLMQPLLELDIFPSDLRDVVVTSLRKPRASSCTDRALYKALQAYDANVAPNEVLLESLPPGSFFTFRKREFRWLERRRTRILVQDVHKKRNYVISGLARVARLDQQQPAPLMLPVSRTAPGDWFLLGTRRFQHEQQKRTRFVCKEAGSGQRYSIHGDTWVTPLSTPTDAP
ncbi:hypothetical protein SAMN05421823_103501 [Catalinimonas alkaloidigena]|uniref:SprT-like family protein n=1 Tax=Catalinimonas alkaloidigena TaxID=1075417 RepID=A0A1G9EKF6_9BACT|nr:hypothetical protein [Catalinimonas alkaloidigena]SDK76505.1 hypothetical protein SAMN05421823_103501 [Catalinimonas alkaloidigena]